MHDMSGIYIVYLGKIISKNKKDESKSHSSVSGNCLLHTLTSGREYSLRIDMQDFEGNTRYALYGNFAVGPAMDGFRLTATGYSGTAGSCV